MIDVDGTRHVHEDRRNGRSRREDSVAVAEERRSGVERRGGNERRMEADTISSQVLAALGLITRAVEGSRLPDDQRRLLDAAMLRLRFALEKLGA